MKDKKLYFQIRWEMGKFSILWIFWEICYIIADYFKHFCKLFIFWRRITSLKIIQKISHIPSLECNSGRSTWSDLMTLCVKNRPFCNGFTRNSFMCELIISKRHYLASSNQLIQLCIFNWLFSFNDMILWIILIHEIFMEMFH
jgi:hypothetical protein